MQYANLSLLLESREEEPSELLSAAETMDLENRREA